MSHDSPSPSEPTSDSEGKEPCQSHQRSAHTPSEPNGIFTSEEIENLVAFAQALKRVHLRLLKEGYTLKQGKLIPPQKPDATPED